MKLSENYERRLADIGGRLPNGKPKLRIVLPGEAVRPHGKLAGSPKYFDPDTGKKIETLMLEQWIPPTLCGTRESWPHELLGPYPADCDMDCCNRGFWGLKSPLSVDGTFLPFDESLMQKIETKQWFDVSWSLLSETQRLEALDANLSSRKQKDDADAWEQMNNQLETYGQYKEKWDNADNRVHIFPEKYQPQGKGIRGPIGRPKIKT